MKIKVLIADEDSNLAEVLKGMFRRMDCTVRACSDSNTLCRLLGEEDWSLLLCSLSLLPDCVCLAPVAVMASYFESCQADEAVKRGLAFVRILKPVRQGDVLAALDAAVAMERSSVQDSCEKMNEPASGELHFGFMIGESPSMQELYSQIERMAASGMNVLIRGESGTGKELAARAIHAAGLGAERPFLALNCSSMSDQLLESELFGHVRGAFTGAVRSKEGLFQAASGGTLFLDEIGSISSNMQRALLRVLEERKVRPVGGTEFIPVNARVIAATNEDLEKSIEDGRFRLDLFHRLNVLPLNLVPLRERREDIGLIAKHIISGSSRPELRLEDDAMAELSGGDWPGNVRQLENVLLRAVALLPGDRNVIKREDLPDDLKAAKPVRLEPGPMPVQADQMTLKAYLKMCERTYLRDTLDRCGGDKEAASRLLGISLATFYRKYEE